MYRRLLITPTALLLGVAFTAACTDTQPTALSGDGLTPSLALADQGTGDPDVPPSTVQDVDHDFAFPSTNADNRDLGWGHVLWVDVAVGSVTLEFHGPRNFFSCFEYRRDGEDNTVVGDNFNVHIADGLWNFTCQNASSEEITIEADTHVDVRLSFGAERDERFDWTRFYIPGHQDALDWCRDNWEQEGFRNLGQCIRHVNTGQDSR